MGFYDLRTNVQAQSQAVAAGGNRVAPKRFEDPADAFNRNRFPGIPHLQYQVMLIGVRGYLDRLLRNSVGQGIGQQIRGHLLQASQIASNGALDMDIGDDFAIRLGVPELLNHRSQAGIDVLDFGQLDSDPPSEPTAREIEHVVDQ